MPSPLCHVELLSFRPAETLPPVSCPGTSSQSQALPTRGQGLFWEVSTRAGILGPRVLPGHRGPWGLLLSALLGPGVLPGSCSIHHLPPRPPFPGLPTKASLGAQRGPWPSLDVRHLGQHQASVTNSPGALTLWGVVHCQGRVGRVPGRQLWPLGKVGDNSWERTCQVGRVGWAEGRAN